MEFVEKKISIANGSYSIIACSVMGKGKKENQDSFNIYHDSNQIIVTLADGLGSSFFSKEGSSKIVKIASELLSHMDDLNNFPLDLFNKWENSIAGELNFYDTTIRFIKIKNDEIICGGIGDGWTAIRTDSTYYSFLSDNMFTNQTDSILTFDLRGKFSIKKIEKENLKSIIIATDGFSEDVDKDRGKEFLEKIETQITENQTSFQEELTGILENWPIESNKDDKTVIIIQKRR